jgi:hypothetical protein
MERANPTIVSYNASTDNANSYDPEGSFLKQSWRLQKFSSLQKILYLSSQLEHTARAYGVDELLL